MILTGMMTPVISLIFIKNMIVIKVSIYVFESNFTSHLRTWRENILWIILIYMI